MNKAKIFTWIFAIVFVTFLSVSIVQAQRTKYKLMWKYKTGESVESVSVSPDGSYIAAGSRDDGNVYFFNREGKLLWKHKPPGVIGGCDAVGAISVSSDGSYIAVGGDYVLFLFSREGKLLWSYETGWGVRDVSVSSNGSYIVEADDAGLVRLFSREGERLWSKSGCYVDISSDSSFIAVGDDDGSVSLLNREGKLLWSQKITDFGVVVTSISSDGSYIAASSYVSIGSCDNQNVYFFNKQGKLLWSYNIGNDVRSISVSSDGSYIAVGPEDDNIYLLNKEGKLLCKYETSGWVDSVSVSSDGFYIVAGSDNNIYFIAHEKLLARHAIDEAKTIVSQQKTVNVAEAESMLSQAEQVFKAGNYVKAKSLAEQAKATVGETKNLSILANKSILQAKATIESEKSEGFNLDDAESLLSRAEQAFKSGDYTNAKSLSEQAKRKAEIIVKAKIAINEAQTTISQTKSKGFNVAQADNLLSNSEDAFNSGDYTNAKSLAEQAKEKAEEISKLATTANDAIDDAKSAVQNAKSKGFYSAEAEVLFSQAEQAFEIGNYVKAKSLAENATALALDIDQDGVSNEEDFAPTIKNIYIYTGTPFALLVLAALTKFSLDVRKRGKIKRLEKQKIRREEERRRLEYERRISKLKAKYEQYKREGYAPDKDLEEMLK